ncbi:hypothetical protein [Bremerella cremea]|uniref:hypothetical protein n=1 Tax=Bremerella cremea TaxID=1031537 RepID=UPI0031E844A1
MASPVETNHLRSNLIVQNYKFDPDGVNPVDVAWRSVRDIKRILIGFTRTVGTGNVDAFKILANAASDGGGTDVEIKAHPLASQPDAINDQIWLECSVEEIAALGAKAGIDLQYFSANVELATATDEGLLTYVLEPTIRKDGNTTDRIA